MFVAYALPASSRKNNLSVILAHRLGQLSETMLGRTYDSSLAPIMALSGTGITNGGIVYRGPNCSSWTGGSLKVLPYGQMVASRATTREPV